MRLLLRIQKWTLFVQLLITLIILQLVSGSEKAYTSVLQHMPHHHHHHYDFDQMSSLIKRLDVIENEAPSLLQAFYEPRLKSFSIKPETGSRKMVCVTSTCYALVQLAISKIYDVKSGYGDVITYDNSMERGKGGENNENTKIPIPKVVDTLLRCPFRGMHSLLVHYLV